MGLPFSDTEQWEYDPETGTVVLPSTEDIPVLVVLDEELGPLVAAIPDMVRALRLCLTHAGTPEATQAVAAALQRGKVLL